MLTRREHRMKLVDRARSDDSARRHALAETRTICAQMREAAIIEMARHCPEDSAASARP